MNDLHVMTDKFKTISELFGKSPRGFEILAGPCSVESEAQLDETASFIASRGLRFIRGGAFKPRTSPYSFQGMGKEGLELLKRAKEKYNLIAVTEAIDIESADLVAEYADVIQVGSRNMQDYSLLKHLGKMNKPVLLKRSYMATMREFLLAAEYIVSGGNDKIILCEKGIRTFEPTTRNTLDISSVALIKAETSLPVIVDISHSLGRKDIVIPVAKAIKALGADGIMAEIHPDPKSAKSDQEQQLTFEEADSLIMNLN